MNHIFSRFGLHLRGKSDRGTHFTAKGLSPCAQCRRQSVVLQLRPTKAERSPSPVKEVPTSLDRTPRDCRQALTCCLSTQNQTMAQQASPSVGPSKPDKEAPGLQLTGKGEDQTHCHRPTTICSTPHKHKYSHFRKTCSDPLDTSAALLGPTSSREELLHTCDTCLRTHLIRCPCVSFFFFFFFVL